ncbi:MAG TPA: lipopolysaccharide transport periplasmic protein LptA [Steroidobacteraceae bacterium]
MARSCRKLPLLLVAALASAAAAAPRAPPPTPQLGQQPITVDAASSEVDYRTNTVVFSEVVIAQGSTRVQADHAHATGLNFANSRWTFEGKVRIDAEQHGNLRSDQATVEFRGNRIARATITGKPAEFEQQRTDSDQMARGHAGEIVYDVSDGTVRLSNQAWLTDGQNEISGPLLVYNVRAQRVQAAASPGTDQRVHITIAPPGAVPGPGKTEPAKQPSPDRGKAEPPKPRTSAQP